MERVDDGGTKSCFDSMIQKHAIEHGTSMRLQAKRDVADAQDGEHAWEFCFDAFDRFQCLDTCRL